MTETDELWPLSEAEDWLRAISTWLLTTDNDMKLPSGILDTDPLDIADRLTILNRTPGRFWLSLRDPGCVPERKGPWPIEQTAKILREFIAARPAAYIDYITVDSFGSPDVHHGPEVLQMTDGRSMGVGRKHNRRVRETEAALATKDNAPAAGYLIRKAGAYYRPKAEGYTRDVAQAGRFTFDEAIAHSYPNGPFGPRDGITYLHESELDGGEV